MKIKKSIAFILVFAILAGMISQEAYASPQEERKQTEKEYTSGGCRIQYQTISSWGNSTSVNVSITNESGQRKNLWELMFQYQGKIENIWNADISQETEGCCRISAKSYNAVIEKGQTVSFGFIASGGDVVPKAPREMELTDEKSREDNEDLKESGSMSSPEPGAVSSIFPPKWDGLNKTVFSGSDNGISLYTCKTNIAGDIHTNGNFTYQGTTLDIQGNLRTAGNISVQTSSMEGARKIQSSSEGVALQEMPDITREVSRHIRETGKHYKADQSFGSDKISVDKSLYVEGSINFNATTFEGKGIIAAGKNIIYNVNQLTTHKDSQIFMMSEQGDIIINGTNITMDAVLYAPKGCVRINANEVNLRGRIIAEQVCINGTLINIASGAGDYDVLDFLLRPQVELKVSGNLKQNRKVVLDLEQIANIQNLKKEDLQWSVEKEGESAGECCRTDLEASDGFHREMIFTEPGKYNVILSAKEGFTEKLAEKELTIVRDDSPAAEFTLEKTILGRNREGEATVTVQDHSCSPDGDEIGIRNWYIYYDANHDGTFSEKEKILVQEGNEKELCYTTKNVGKYKVCLEIEEIFEDTIPKLLPENASRKADTEKKPGGGCVFEVVNKAPRAEVDIQRSHAADIVFTVGDVDQEKLQLYEKKAEELEKDLKEKGVDARIDVAETSVLTAQDRFAWQEFDHFNYIDCWDYINLDRHIVFQGNDIKMIGYSYRPVRDFLYVSDSSPGQKIFEFDLQKDGSNWHSMEGGGFLFNATVSEEKNTIQGFCILVSQTGLKLVQIDSKDLKAFRDGKYYEVQDYGKLIWNFALGNLFAEHHFRIVVDRKTISVWDGDKLVIDKYVLPENDYGYGFGPITAHGGHYCPQQSYFTFRNIIMRTVKGKSLSDILSGYSWREGASHYVVNISEKEIPELASAEQTGDLAKVLIENEASFAGIGNEENADQYRRLLNATGTGGAVYSVEDLGTQMDRLSERLTESLLAEDTEIDTYITTDDRVVYKNYYQDEDGDQIHEAKWVYEYTPKLFDIMGDKKETIIREEKDPITIFKDPGAYAVWLSVCDDPAGENEALKDYRKWSEKQGADKLLLVHQRPSAKVRAVAVEDGADPTKCILKVDYHAEDKDHPEDGKKGIRKEWYSYKKLQDSDWTEGKIPNKVEMGETYLIRYVAEDIEGALSFPSVAVVKTTECRSYKEIEDKNPPTAYILPEKLEVALGEEVYIEGYAEDDCGIDSFEMKIDGKTVLSSFGQVRFQPEKEGTVTVTAKAKDIGGNVSEKTIKIQVVDRRDKTAPTAVITAPRSGSDISTSVQIKGTVKDETAFAGYTLTCRRQGEETETTIAAGTEEKEDEVLGTLDIHTLKEGIYDIRLTAEDQTGNKASSGLLLYVEKRSETIESIYRLEAGITGIVYDETEKQIHIYGMAQAEGHLEQYVLSSRRAGSGDYKVIATRREETEKEILLGCLDASEMEAGEYEVLLEASDARGNKVTASASFELIIETKETTITVTEVIRQEPVVVPATPENIPEPTVTPEITGAPTVPTAAPTKTPAVTPGITEMPTAAPTIKPAVTPEPSATPQPGLPEVDYEKLDEILNRSFGLTLSQDIAFVGAEITAYVTLPFTVKEDSVVIEMDGKVIAAKTKQVSFTKGKAGKVTITARGVDQNGDLVKDTKECIFYHDNDKNPPVAAFDAPQGEAILTEPVDIIGSAYDAEEMDYYTLEYRVCGAEDFLLLEESTEPKKHQPLGHLDTTMLPNGHYEVRLSVVDKGGNRNRVTRKYVVEGSLKTGAMNLGFTDITTAMSGAKINVNRTYSSANKNKGDFGIGWNLGMQGMTLSETTPLHEGYKLTIAGSWFAPGYRLNETRSHDIIIAYGDGTSDRFELTMTPDRRELVPIHEAELGYRCVTDPGVKLEIDGKNLAVIQDTEMLLPDTSMYRQVKYKLTTREGTAIYLSAATGVTKMEDRSGNTIRVDRNGYHSEDGRSITFTRDSEDRIICAEDPAGKQTRYAYDEAGNLSGVTDAAGRTITFHYDREHNLTGITDPSGAAVARNEYGEDGRLTAVIDAEGNRTEYGYDIQGKTQVVKDRLGNSTVYVYDDRGNILQQTDANGNTTKNTYDSSGNLMTKTDANGNTTKYAYDGSGNITSVTDAEGNTLKNTYSGRNLITAMKSGDDEILIDYDEAGNIEETTDLAGNKTHYEHDENGCVTGIADAIGTLASAQYDGDGNVIQNTDSAGIKTTYTYDGEGNRLTQTRHVETEVGIREQTTKYVYDEAGDLVQTIDPEGNATAIERNLLGQMTASTDAQGRRTTYGYNRQGEVSRVTYADGTAETFAYDPEGRVTESVNRLGQKQTYTYDKAGNLLKSTDNRGNSTTYAYDHNYNVISMTNAAGAETVYTYDALNRNTSVTDAEGNTTKFTYNRYSFLTGVTDAKGNTTTYEYNKAGNRIKTIHPDGSSVESGYDGRGRTLWQKDAAGTKTEYTYDGADRLTRVENPASGTTSYTYDKAGNLCAVEDANGNVTSYEYDVAGRLTKTTQADGSTATKTYDRYGRLEKSTDYNSVTTTVEYDSQDRVVQEKTGTSIKSHAYDTYGRLTEISSEGSTIRYAYNKYGELSEKTYENGQKISYGYDRFGRKESVTVKAGDRVLDRTTYAYDAMDRITRVVAKDGTATAYTYDENGNRKTATFASGVRITYEYDELNRLLVQKTIDSTGALIAQYQYTTGKNGERTKIQEEGPAGKKETEYDYDGAGRLTGERTVSADNTGKKTETSYTYEYDNAGNRIRKKVSSAGTAAATEYTYNSRNQLAEEETKGQKTRYHYDANGNLLKKSGASAEESYTYDVYNRLVSCQSDREGKKETFTYDAEGVRRSRTTSQGKEKKETLFISDTSGELSRTLAETDGKGELLASYGWGDALSSQTREGRTSDYLYDGQGNVRGLLDQEGSLTDTYAYNAYGELTAKTGETENHFLYTGEYYDGVSGLYYLRARYMNPETGTFTSMDTWQGDMYEPVTLHKYLYANANPVKYKDPSGNMGSLQEFSITNTGYRILESQQQINFMGLMSAVASSTLTALTGGSEKEIQEAFFAGYFAGIGLGMLMCAVVIINVAALLSTAALVFAGVNFVALSILTIYSEAVGDSQRALTYASLIAVAYIGTCEYLNVSGEATVTGSKGTAKISTSKAENVKLPQNDAQIKHIFRNKIGHLSDSIENRDMILNVANDKGNFLGKDSYGNSWYAQIQDNGSQIWVRTRNGVINNAGVNDMPREWNSKTGLNNNSK